MASLTRGVLIIQLAYNDRNVHSHSRHTVTKYFTLCSDIIILDLKHTRTLPNTL